MVANKWVKTRSYYGGDEDVWFYFGNSGKVVKDGWKKIDGRNYLFDSEGVMQTGWTEDNLYYLGSDGAMKTGWRYLEPPYDEDEELDDYSMANESAEAESVEELEMALERAIKDENYELASVLRDKIKKQK